MQRVICPTVLAEDKTEFAAQLAKIGPFAKRIQIDLMDGQFASPKSVGLDDIWLPAHITTDVHLMYQNPMDHLQKILHLKPHLVIVHVEAMFHHMHFAAELHKEGINSGLAIMPETPIANIEQILHSFDHLLIFSGSLGHFGGHANLELLEKVKQAKLHHPNLEIGWDGGINTENIKQLADGGVNIFNVGGYIQKSEDPGAAYATLVETLG